MTPAVRAKLLGLDNLQALIDHTKSCDGDTQLSRDQLSRWVNDRPMLFDMVVMGYLTMKAIALKSDAKIEAI